MKKIYALLLILLSFICNAQSPADVAQNFGSVAGFDNAVYSIALQPDGKMIVAGDFTSYNGVTENKIVRLNIDGTKDTTFNTGFGFSSSVYTIALQPDGKIVVGGNFSFYNGIAENRIIRLNSNGTGDTTFNTTGTGFNNQIRSIVLQPDGKILVSGFFTSYNEEAQSNITRLNSDGSKDPTFLNVLDFNQYILAIGLQPDGKIIVDGANFSNASGVTVITKRFLRLNSNGTVDYTFNTGTGVNNQLQTIAVQPDGKIIIGGIFTSFNGATENRIVRLNSDGTKDTTFITGSAFNGGVRSIALQTDGKIILGGNFTAYKGITESRIIRLNNDGTKDATFSAGTGFENIILSIALQTDGKIIVGGNFSLYNGLPAYRFTRLNNNGTKDTNFNNGTGFNSGIRAIAIQPNGGIIVGGFFNSYNGLIENRIIRLNNNGNKDTTFNTGIGFDGQVISITLQSDGKMIVTGEFTSYNGLTENRIIRLNSNGTKDTTFITGTGFNIGSVQSVAIQSDGKMIVVGEFYSYNGIPESHIVRLNSNGTKDTTFNNGNGFSLKVQSIVLQPDGKMIVGGDFYTYNGVNVNYMVRLNSNGTIDTTFNTGLGFNSSVQSIALQADGKIIVAGFFTSYNGVTVNRIVRLNSNGTIDATFTTGLGVDNLVQSIVIQPDGKIIMGGFFTFYNGTTENYLVRLNSNGTKDTTFNTGTGFNYEVYTIALKSDGKIVLGGYFTSYKSIFTSANLITLYGNSVLSNEEFLNTNDIILWPNPTNNAINISGLNEPIISVNIYSLKGELIYEKTDYHNSIDVSTLASGIYFTKILTENGVFSRKFMKE